MTNKDPKPLPPLVELKARFAYEPATGKLYRRRLARKYFSSQKGWKMYNSKHAGKEAGTLKPSGYIDVRAGDGIYKAHRIIWKWITGEEPGLEMDHINGIRSDNRFENLLSLTEFGTNNMNCKKYKNNTSGQVGVYQLPSGNWIATGNYGGKMEYLGVQPSYQAAVQARLEWQKTRGFSERHGR